MPKPSSNINNTRNPQLSGPISRWSESISPFMYLKPSNTIRNIGVKGLLSRKV